MHIDYPSSDLPLLRGPAKPDAQASADAGQARPQERDPDQACHLSLACVLTSMLAGMGRMGV